MPTPSSPQLENAVDSVFARVGKHLVVATPLGIGKPNAWLNALYARVKADPSTSLEIVTALSLNPPRGGSELEERFLAPVRERVWRGYPRLDYVDDRQAGTLPDNVRVVEFYVPSGSALGQPATQRHILSANYTHAARDSVARGVNVIAQALAVRHDADGTPHYSYSSNPDVTAEAFSRLDASSRRFVSVAQINRKLPWMGHRARVPAGRFDVVIDDASLDHEPFGVPHEPVSRIDHAIGVRASALVRDGGTLQVGIGALGDAVCHALRLRHTDNAGYRSVLEALGAEDTDLGGRGTFEQGLYVASELLSAPLFALHRAGVVRRKVYDSETGGDAGGTTMQGAFLLGPRSFYRALCELPDDERALVDMAGVAEVNRVYQAYDREREQRRHARFLNVTMKVSLLGAAVSDQLADGQMVSGVGGQHDFVSMAHQLPEGRSVLMFRATRGQGRALESNVVWEYPHTTIARHLRDVFVTEYGVADLRAKTDEECIQAMLCIADSRLQEELLEQARRAGKIDPDWQIPAAHRHNLPERLEELLAPATNGSEPLLPRLPFGSDLTDDELDLASRLRRLAAVGRSPLAALRLAKRVVAPADDTPALQAALRHLRLDQPGTAKERVLARLVRAAYTS